MNHAMQMTTAFVAALALGVLTKFWLASRQIRHVAAHRDAVPPAFAHVVDLPAHRKAADCTVSKTRLGLLELAWGAAILLGWTLLGGLDSLNQALLARIGAGLWQQLALLAVFTAINGLLELPLTLWQIFSLEQRFGFNRMRWPLWLADTLKGWALSAVIGLPLAALILWLMDAAGSLWWLWSWGAWAAFSLLLMLVYPNLIAPLFNRFQPLDDPTLKTRVNALMQRCGFASKGLFVMDGSRRSAHANAYFTGFGRSKRVVFYDTLLRQLDAGEVEAVLAHELGHFRHGHVARRMVLMLVLSLAGFALLGWLSSRTWFYVGLGVMPNMVGPNSALALLLFALVLPVFGVFLAPLGTQLSRRDEFQADAFAMAHSSGANLRAALLKLYQDNAATLTPDPLFAAVYYSHPPAAQRLARMSEN